MPEWLLLVTGVVLTLGTGIFVASEFALVNLDRAELEARRERGESRLSMTIAALRSTSTHLSSAQLGITLTTLLAGYTLEPALSFYIDPLLIALGMSEQTAPLVGIPLGVAIATIGSMIIGELVPKNLALAIPRQTAKLVIPLQTGFTWAFRPAVAVLNGSADAILRVVGVEPKEELSGARTAEELASLVRRSASEGTLEQDTATLLERTLQFSELTASDVMTPRPSTVTVEAGDTAATIIDLTRQTGLSRFPVTEDGNADDIVGLVHIKNAVSVPRDKRASVPAGALMTEAVRVPETIGLDALLVELRGRGLQMAIVVDEYGGTAGVVTLEDLVEELVGELADEHDRSRADVVTSAGGVTFPASLRPDELLDRAGIEVPEDPAYETVAGYVLSRLGRLAVVGDEVPVEGGSLRVVRLDGRRVDRLRFVPSEPADGAERADGADRG